MTTTTELRNLAARTSEATTHRIRLLVSGEDRPGIVSTVSSILGSFSANIISLDQYSTDFEGGRFFQRTEFHLEDFSAVRPELELELHQRLTVDRGLAFTLRSASQLKRVAIFASKTDHCLLDLLWRHRRGELPMNVTMVTSNHPDLAVDVRQFGIPFMHVPVDRDDRSVAEQRHLDLCRATSTS